MSTATTVPVMGTGATLLAAVALPDELVARIRRVWEELEQRFSLYRPDSEASRLAAGEIALPDASPQTRDAYGDALAWRSATGGDFTPHRPDGVIDLSGIVKAYGIRDAGGVLDAAGIGDWLVDIGGDVLSRSSRPGTWRAGIADPHSPSSLLTSVPLGERWTAIATSGTAARGEHVWRSTQLGDLIQVTVAGRDIVEADVLATAILAGGLPALDAATRNRDVDVLTVARDGALRVTPRLRMAIAREGLS